MANHRNTPSNLPAWVTFPDSEWEKITPEQAGLNAARFRAWVQRQKPQFGVGFAGQKPAAGGVVIARAGYIVTEWGDPDFRYQSASLGKTFTRMALQLALDSRLIKSADEPVCEHWTGEGLLAPHKVLTVGHHRMLTFRHLRDMAGGFPVTNGHGWRANTSGKYVPGVPEWAHWTGDPDHDNYAHVPPGQHEHYSSGGYWRLSQALTAIWAKDLKRVLDELIMTRIGIPPGRWDWLTGEHVRQNRDFYPECPGYGDFLDPPYRIGGVAVSGGGGWVVMSASDLARVGLLIATSGVWKGRRLITRLAGNAGVGTNMVDGWGAADGTEAFFSLGRVATAMDDPTPTQMASWINGPVRKEA